MNLPRREDHLSVMLTPDAACASQRRDCQDGGQRAYLSSDFEAARVATISGFLANPEY